MCDTISNGKIGASIMADLKGAFDATWRKGLMYKIYDNGITGNLFLIINSYLENRRARNLVNNFTSDWFYTTKGLPQGSIICPILLILFTGDLSADPRANNSIIDRLISQSSTGNNSNTFNVKSAKPQESKFADDYNLWKTATNLPDLESNLQKDLDVLLEWCHKWRINIDIKKTVVIVFSGKKNTPNINLKINNNTIKQATTKRMFGVIIDEKLTFKYHIKHICMQARKSYSQLAAFPNLPLSTLKILYKSFIRSKLECSYSVWGHKLYLHNNLQNIESVQRGVLSLILRPFKSTPTIALESELNILPIDIRLKQLQAMECIKILRKRENPLKDKIMTILETPTTYSSPLQHLAKMGKELLVKITKTRITNISDVKIEPEPMITSTTTHNISIENICKKDKKKDNEFINNQIKKFPNDTIVIFTDGSCANNPGPTGAGSLIFKDGINNPPIKFA